MTEREQFRQMLDKQYDKQIKQDTNVILPNWVIKGIKTATVGFVMLLMVSLLLGLVALAYMFLRFFYWVFF